MRPRTPLSVANHWKPVSAARCNTSSETDPSDGRGQPDNTDAVVHVDARGFAADVARVLRVAEAGRERHIRVSHFRYLAIADERQYQVIRTR